MSPFAVAAVADMGVMGTNTPTIMRQDLIPNVSPVLEHTTIEGLAAVASEYDFVVRNVPIGLILAVPTPD
jgi:hypothetical protein